MLEGSCLCGQLRWRCDAMPESATACNCTACRRYGVLWAYGHQDEDIHVWGETRAFSRPHQAPPLAFHFCPACGCVGYWRATSTNGKGKRRIAVNLRLSEPDVVAAILIDHFDGLDSFEDLPRDGTCVADLWF